MARNHIRHLPVRIGNRPVGIVTDHDVLAAETCNYRERVQDLERYLFEYR